MLIGHPQHGGRDYLRFNEERYKPVDYNEVKTDSWSRSGELGMLVRPDLCPAAAHLRHTVAFAMHGTTASAFLLIHRAIGHAGQ